MLNNAKFVLATILVSIMLLSLVVGTCCLRLTEPVAGSPPASAYTGPTTFWVYAAVSWAVTFVTMIILLYGTYCWASCAAPSVEVVRVKTSRRKSACVY